MDDVDPNSLLQSSVENARQRRRALTPIPMSELPPASAIGNGINGEAGWDVPNPLGDPKRHPFEVYVVGYTSAPQTTARCQIAWGTVRDTEKITDIVTITDLDTTIELTSGDKVWLEVVFSVSGSVVSITSCAVKKGVPASNGWTTYPNEMKYTSASSYTWYHLIAYVRELQSNKGTLLSLPNTPPDSGEFPDIEPNLVIAQCTNTHLVAQQQCMMDYDVSPNLIRSAARLVPGPGGII